MEKQIKNNCPNINKVESLVIFQCNCRCLMCSVGNKMNSGSKNNKIRSFDSIKNDIDKASAMKASEFAFSGGEPTLRKDLPELVRYARGRGFQVIEIQSNGRIYANKYYGEKMIKAGVNSFVISLHSCEEDINDQIMKAPGAFGEQVQGIRNLNNSGQSVKINIVITKLNYKHLAEHLLYLSRNFNISEIRLSFILLEGFAGQSPEKVAVSMKEVSPYLVKALEVAKDKVNCFVYNIPPCLLQGYEEFVNDLDDLNTYLIGSGFDTYLNQSQKEEKTKPRVCEKCLYNSRCFGVWKKYVQVFGLKEIKPVL